MHNIWLASSSVDVDRLIISIPGHMYQSVNYHMTSLYWLYFCKLFPMLLLHLLRFLNTLQKLKLMQHKLINNKSIYHFGINGSRSLFIIWPKCLCWCRHLQRNTDFHTPCWVMRITKSEKSGEFHLIFLVHCLVDKPMFLTRTEWFSLSITISFSLRSTLMRPWSSFKVFEPFMS